MNMHSQSVNQTELIGEALGRCLLPGDVVCLSGDLGAGKTALTRGIGRGWGAVEAVTSPTFTLVHEHQRPQDGATLYHIDCYRLESGGDAWTIGLDDMMHGDGVLVLEWPENVQDVLPVERLWITLEIAGESKRQIGWQASGVRYEQLVANVFARFPDE